MVDSFIDWSITKNIAMPEIRPNKYLVEKIEDWSRVRSPSRARRRMKRGYEQNVVVRNVPSTKFYHDKINNVMYCHPETYEKFQQRIKEAAARISAYTDDAFYKSIRGDKADRVIKDEVVGEIDKLASQIYDRLPHRR